VAKVLPTAVAAVLLLVPQTKQAIAALLSLTAQDVALLVILLPTATVLILLSTSTPRSAFASPGQFVRLLKNLTNQHLAPYAAGAALVVHECLRQQQVYVVGAAGIGKSTLVERLVIAELSKEHSVLPIYIRQLDDDTPNVDEATLAIALRSAIQREGLQDTYSAAPAGASPFDILDRLVEQRRIPLLVFDHFDDYLAANLHWISVLDLSGTPDVAVSAPLQSSEVRQRSTFWDRIASRVAKNSLKTIYVTTPDLIAFVSCFRFGPRVVQCPAFELQVAEADAYLSQLEAELEKASTPIRQPDDGWNVLKRRLLADLAPRQTCLPHQLNVALQGLANLPFATLDAYLSNGGLPGLSASTVDVMADEIANTEVAGRGTELWSPESVLLICAGLSLLPGGRGSVEQALGQAASLPDGPTVKLPPIDDPRWGETMLRLCARRLVRLTRQAGTDRAAYELRHPYIGAAAQAALQRRAPLEAGLVRHAARHSAAASWVEWWRTLLPPLHLARLVWARLRTGFRFRGHRRYAIESSARIGVWGLAGITYVLLADAGMALPFGDAARKGVDNFGVTIFRQPVEVATSVAELKGLRDRLGEAVVQRCQATKWCNAVDGTTNQLNEQPWATSQALAAVLGLPNAKVVERPWLSESLQALFSSRHKVSDGQRTLGWTLGDLSTCPVAEPSLWLSVALARASGNAQRSSELVAKLPAWSAEVDQAVASHSLGSASNPAPFIEFLANTKLNTLAPPSVYATSLSLLRDLDRVAYDATARPRIEGTVKWLLEHKKPRGHLEPADGWQSAFVPGQAISAGVTMQVLYGLLRARQVVPQAVPEDVTRLALSWIASFAGEQDPFLESVSFYYGECKVDATTTTFGHVVRYLWYPWAIGTALELHQAAETPLSRGQKLVVARALDHFRQLSRKGFPPAEIERQPTYKLSEFIFTMASAR
jgi:hypothetical protein